MHRMYASLGLIVLTICLGHLAPVVGQQPDCKGDGLSNNSPSRVISYAGFALTQPRKLSIEINGKIDRTRMLFANAPETEIPNPDDPDVLYFGPGIHKIEGDKYGILRVKDGQTVYIAGGAVVRGRIHGSQVKNVRILGRGILDGGTLPARLPLRLRQDESHRGGVPQPLDLDRPFFVDFRSTRNLEINGITMIDPPSWALITTPAVASSDSILTRSVSEERVSTYSISSLTLRVGVPEL